MLEVNHWRRRHDTENDGASLLVIVSSLLSVGGGVNSLRVHQTPDQAKGVKEKRTHKKEWSIPFSSLLRMKSVLLYRNIILFLPSWLLAAPCVPFPLCLRLILPGATCINDVHDDTDDHLLLCLVVLSFRRLRCTVFCSLFLYSKVYTKIFPWPPFTLAFHRQTDEPLDFLFLPILLHLGK